jgi:6-phosphogluconate dehydrogenase
MQIGMIGLGRMGANMVRRLRKHGHECVVYDRSADTVKMLAREGAISAGSLSDLVDRLNPPKAVWIMLPAGDAVESTINHLYKLLSNGSTVIDGGNSFYKDDIRRSHMLHGKGIEFLDVGTSGGVWGLERGYCLTIGGDESSVARLEPVFAALANDRTDHLTRTPGRESFKGNAERGFLYCGPSGAGHFVKMIHNGIEYGLMQSYAEGFDIMYNANSEELPTNLRYQFNLTDIAELWRHGSVVSSWLLDLMAIALAEDPKLSRYCGFVHDSGEGRWAIQAALEEAVPAEVISAALYARFRSRQRQTFAERILSAMRHMFGGHVEEPSQM